MQQNFYLDLMVDAKVRVIKMIKIIKDNDIYFDPLSF